MARYALSRNFISLGITPEVRAALENYMRAMGGHLTPQEAARELILLGSGVPCDTAMILLMRQQLRIHGEEFLTKELRMFAKSLEEKLRIFLASAQQGATDEG